ncbi:hypothetical protein [Pseudonocardia xishanensis]|uniref:hypothetical protein n=1 Tax=Pseudonocardia xishanensis TaxID=630995 RepID=UPI0031EFFA31
MRIVGAVLGLDRRVLDVVDDAGALAELRGLVVGRATPVLGAVADAVAEALDPALPGGHPLLHRTTARLLCRFAVERLTPRPGGRR